MNVIRTTSTQKYSKKTVKVSNTILLQKTKIYQNIVTIKEMKFIFITQHSNMNLKDLMKQSSYEVKSQRINKYKAK